MAITQKDKDILRGLGNRIAEIAALPVQDYRRKLAQQVENLEQTKPTVQIYQEPWNELNMHGELEPQCSDDFCKGIEGQLRRTLYKWDHYQDDTVISADMPQPYCIRDTGFGISEDVDIQRTDATSDVVSRHYNIQISEESDADKIKYPEISHDEAQTEREFQMRSEIFDGILNVSKVGVGGFWFAPWDELVRWTGVTEVLTDMAMRPEYVHVLMEKFVSAWLYKLDQYVEQDLLAQPLEEMWAVGAAQIFSEVSPAMHEEFALKHEARWYSRFGKSYYGCCEPLHNKVDIIRKNIPNLRKISMSPWVDFDKAVKNVGSDLIFAWKPNPAIFAGDAWNPDAIRKDMREKLQKAKDGGCIVEIHLKDISTVRYHPEHLWEWAKIAQEETKRFE